MGTIKDYLKRAAKLNLEGESMYGFNMFCDLLESYKTNGTVFGFRKIMKSYNLPEDGVEVVMSGLSECTQIIQFN